MRYLVHWDNQISRKFAELLLRELARFDVRSSFGFLNSVCEDIDLEDVEFERLDASSAVRTFQPECIISIGTHPNKQIAKITRRSSSLSFFFLQTISLDRGVEAIRRARKSFDYIFTDLPQYAGLSEFKGTFLVDLIRKHTVAEMGAQDDGMCVAVFAESKGDLKFCERLVATSAVETSWLLSHRRENSAFEETIDSLKKANAAVVFTDQQELLAALLSCPAVRVQESGGLFSRRSVNSLVDSMLGKFGTSIARDRKKVGTELQRILYDHEYCASKLADNQQALDLIGNQPVIRTIGQEIIERLEERENLSSS